MNKKLLLYTTVIALLSFNLSCGYCKAQAREVTNDFYAGIAKYDWGSLLTCDSILVEDMEEGGFYQVARPLPLGFIGNDYQRFEICFISLIKHPANPYQYLAYGKTRVRGHICTFQGTITLTGSRITTFIVPGIREGDITATINLYEDNRQAAAGVYTGTLRSQFMIDAGGHFRYNTLEIPSDAFCNSQFTGSWTSYTTRTVKKCNWGDYRIPQSGDLDMGAGEFSVNEKYIQNGWQSFVAAWRVDPETAEGKKVIAKA